MSENNKFPTPFLGSIIIKLQAADKKFKSDILEIPDEVIKNNYVTIFRKGEIVAMAEDCFVNSAFKNRFGTERTKYPTIGDIVIFIPHQSTPMVDFEGHAAIRDEDICFFYSKEESK